MAFWDGAPCLEEGGFNQFLYLLPTLPMEIWKKHFYKHVVCIIYYFSFTLSNAPSSISLIDVSNKIESDMGNIGWWLQLKGKI